MQCSVRVEHSETKKVVQSWQTAIHVRQDSIVTRRALKSQVVKIVFFPLEYLRKDHCAAIRASFMHCFIVFVHVKRTSVET